MSHRLTKEELDEQFEQFLKESLSDDSFGSNKKSKVLENLGKPIIKRTKKKDTPPWWAVDDDSDGDLVTTSRSFLKSQSTSQPIEEVEEENHIEEMQQSTQDPLITSIEKDSLEIDESVMAYGPNQNTHGVGLDTLEEQEEKERFFSILEKGASSTIDYSRLNKELDSSDSSQLTALVCNNETPKSEDGGIKELSGNYSEDFEDDPGALSPVARNSEEVHDGLENNKKEEENHEMLAKVMLLDSMDSTIDTQKLLQQTPESVTLQDTNEAMGTGISNSYTNSEMEALHQAYQNLNQLVDTDEQNNYLKATYHTNTSLVDTVDSTGKGLKEMLTGESEISTVDELLQPLRGDQGFFIKPLSDNKKLGSVDKDPKSITEGKKDSLEWFSGKSELKRDLENFPVPEFELQHDCNKTMGQNNQSQHLLVASKEPSRSELFAMHQGERSGNVVKFGNYPNVSKTTSGLLQNKQSNKIVKSPTSVLKKGQNAHYAYVKSSGYGKTSTPTKPSTAAESFQSKTFLWQRNEKSPTIKKQQKGILSDTRTIRFAEDIDYPEDTRTSSAQHSAIQGHLNSQRIAEPISSYGDTPVNEPAVCYSNSIGGDVTVLQRLQNIEQKLNTEHGHTAAPREDFSQKEEGFKLAIQNMQLKYEEEIKQLKQENYMLETKLHADEEKMKIRSHLLGDKNNPATKENLQKIRQEIEEQETLLKGYQQENERLYQQVKELQLKNKENEEHMFKENQALKADIISFREKLNISTRSNHYAAPGNESNSQGFTELIAELRTLQKKEASLLDDIARCKQEKQALEVDFVQLKKERDLLKNQISNTSDEKTYEMKMMEESYKQEISRLNKRLQWFSENQEILDKDAARLKDAYEQIEKLKIRVEQLTQNAGNQSVLQQQRLKVRSADTKRIQDLERQVKEMEGIIKRRHPNSIPAIMYAAAAVSETDHSAKSSTVSFLERRIQKLESDLESKDEEAKKSLRSMEQQFQKVKIQYESRIKELEELLSQKAPNESKNDVDSTVKVKALEQELSIFREAHHITVMNLQKEVETLKEKNSFFENKTIAKIDEVTEQSRRTRLNQELIAKHKEIQELSKTVERLQKERMLMLSSKHHLNSVGAKGKHIGASKADVMPPYKGSTVETESFPAMLDEKLYQPDTFADLHICDLQQENDGLQAEVHKLSQEINQQNIKYDATLAHREDAMKRLKEENAEQIVALKNLHQRDMEKLIYQHALEHSSSRVAELSSKVSTQEILIKHLQKQVSELLKDRESLAVLRIREETLQNEVTKLLDELKTAKECHTPEMRHYLTLESKIKYMEMRHSQREQDLQQVVQQTRHAAESTQTRETDKWKKLVQQKNMELEKFRTELDAILDVLRVLQRQGIVIPTT